MVGDTLKYVAIHDLTYNNTLYKRSVCLLGGGDGCGGPKDIS